MGHLRKPLRTDNNFSPGWPYTVTLEQEPIQCGEKVVFCFIFRLAKAAFFRHIGEVGKPFLISKARIIYLKGLNLRKETH